MREAVTAHPIVEVPPGVSGGAAIRLDATAQGDPFVWYLEQAPSGWRIFQVRDGVPHLLPLPEVSRAGAFVRSLTDQRYVVVDPGRHGLAKENAAVYRGDGSLSAIFDLGDAIRDVQVGTNDSIWVSYAYQGDVGLQCFDTAGKLRFSLADIWQQAGIPAPGDTYALNVWQHETWLYYYPDLVLVKLVDGVVAGQWEASAIRRSHTFATDGEQVLFVNNNIHPHGVELFFLFSGAHWSIEVLDEHDEPLIFDRSKSVGAGPRLYLYANDQVYAVEMHDLPS
jgi:hypothetical protein